MSTTVRQAFNEYKANLEITERQESLVAQRRTNVVKALKTKLSLHSEESKVIGSWDRNTLTRYLSEGDVDVMMILHYEENRDWDNADGTIKCLDRFRSILAEAYPSTEMSRDRNCITIKFSEFRLDVVPAFKNKNGYYTIPDSIRKAWVPTNPFNFADAITEVNKKMDQCFVPLVKMVKGWNRQVGWPIRSFHLECLMYEKYKSYNKGYTFSSMVKVFFDELPWRLSGATYDPIMGDRVDTYLDTAALKTRRVIAIEKAQSAARASADAYSYEESDEETSIRKWKALLGDFFPSYG